MRIPGPKTDATTTTTRRRIGKPTRPSDIRPFQQHAERRQLTVLFCDLVESTNLAAALDPEEFDEILRRYQLYCSETISNAGGLLAETQGDGIVAYFGYLSASESNAERAIRAALALAGTIPMAPIAKDRQLAVRIGIASGIVVANVHPTLEQQGRAVGPTLNLAARLQSVALPNQVVIADATKRLADPLFRCENLGHLSLKGFPAPIQAWRVLGPRLVWKRTRTAGEGPPPAIVDRRSELQTLRETWSTVLGGQVRIVNVVGEAGIGKSRLILEFRRSIAADRHFWIEDGGSQFFSGTPFHPVSQMIRKAIGRGHQGSAAIFKARIEALLRQCDIGSGAALSVLSEMLDLPIDDKPLFALPPTSAKRTLMFSFMQELLKGASRLRPIVVVLEDLHWADASTVELLGYLAKEVRAVPVMIITTARPGTRFGSWARGSTTITLDRVSDEELGEIIGELPALAIATDETKAILRRAEGVPLFGIEIALLFRGQPDDDRMPLGEFVVPGSLSDLLMARLDQLGPAKRVAQLASVIGVQVPLRIMEAIWGLSPRTLLTHIARLKKRGILQTESDADGTIVYSFRHAMIRDAAYESLLKSDRRDLHGAIARAISASDGWVGSHPELLAQHWTHAGEIEASANAWEEAGRYASRRHAFTEAERAYASALDALMQQPASPDRDQRELGLRNEYANTLRITRGISAQKTKEATSRARDLADLRGDREQQLVQAWGSWAAASSGGDFVAAQGLADRFRQLALADGREESVATACMVQMTSKFRLGDVLGAEQEFVQGLRFFEDERFRARPGFLAQTYGNGAMIAWTLGDDASAGLRILQALRDDEAEPDPFDVAYGKLMHAVYLVLSDRHADAADQAAACVALCDKFGIAQFAASSRIALGRAKVGLGLPEEGVALIRKGVDEMLAGSVRVAVTRYATWLAEACLACGRTEEALAAANAALEVNPQEFFFRPASMLVRGEVRRALGLVHDAERDVTDAIQLSRMMGAARFAQRAEALLRRWH